MEEVSVLKMKKRRSKRVDITSNRIKIRSKQTADKHPENLTVRKLTPFDIHLPGVILLHKTYR
jgi:hypothetical protein